MGKKLSAIVGGIKKFMSFAGKKDIKDLQQKYEAHQEKFIKVVLEDMKRAIMFRVVEGKLNYNIRGAKEAQADIEAHMLSDTLLNLLAGRLKVRNHLTGKDEFDEYRYFDAVRWGDVRVYGDMSSNDNQLAMRVFDDGLREMQAELFPDIVKGGDGVDT